jgi:hypothetical protein
LECRLTLCKGNDGNRENGGIRDFRRMMVMVRGMKRLMAFFVVFTLLFQMTDMPLHAENSRDVSALLTVKEAYIETKS